MNKVIRSALAALSKYDMDLRNNYEQARKFQRVTRPYVKSIVCNMMERVLHLEGRDIVLRAFSHTGKVAPIMIFFHGGGFVTGDVSSYSNICANLSEATGRKIIAVDYRLAPEHPFPAGVEDCYAATQAILSHCADWYQADPEDVILIGDSAGATLACVVSMLARDRGGLTASGQILIYPAAWGDYGNDCPFASVRENGTGYLLTQKQLQDYMELYKSREEDVLSPYFAPLRHSDFSRLPETLVLTMEYDPLRDEGEELAQKLREGGTPTLCYRIKNGIHGLFSLPRSAPLTKEIYRHIIHFTTKETEEPEESEKIEK